MSLLLWMCLWSVPAFGQIIVPAESRQYVPIPISVKTGIPEGARTKGPGWVLPPGISEENIYHLDATHFILCAPPGKYEIAYRLSWLHIVAVTFTDGSGKEITIQSYLGDGDYDNRTTFTVLGGGPDPPPLPEGTRWSAIWEEASQRNQHPGIGNLYLQLRKEFQDDRLLIMDVTNLPPRLRALESQRPPSLALPVLMVLVRQPDKTDKVLRTVPLPSSVAAVKQEIAK